MMPIKLIYRTYRWTLINKSEFAAISIQSTPSIKYVQFTANLFHWIKRALTETASINKKMDFQQKILSLNLDLEQKLDRHYFEKKTCGLIVAVCLRVDYLFFM